MNIFYNKNLVVSNKIYNYWINSNNYYSMQDIQKFQNYFLHFIDLNKNYINFKIYDIQDINEIYNKNIINIMLCVENCNHHKHYSHINKYNDFGNENISIYLYNHHDKFIQTLNYIVIPLIYLQIDYFNIFYNKIKPSIYTYFSKKKFCLMVSIDIKNYYNNIIKNLRKIGNIDNIKLHINEIKNKSCYHSIELLNLFNQYKFIFCFENSFTNGYITEKIFNVFFSKSIPLYIGPDDTNRYFNSKSYINVKNLNDKIINKIKKVALNEKLYNNIIKKKKFNIFDNEDYISKSKLFINEKYKEINK